MQILHHGKAIVVLRPEQSTSYDKNRKAPISGEWDETVGCLSGANRAEIFSVADFMV